LSEYLEIDIRLHSRQESGQELVLALLAVFGFDGFREEEGRIYAYIPAEKYSSEAFETFLAGHQLKDKIRTMKITSIPECNWNAVWEKSCSPVQISGNCMVRAPFHPPRKGIEYDLVISPKMSFGTAHHETTRLVLESILDRNWSGQKVLDFGCGTGVLAILADKMGAGSVIALDNDPLACSNASENIVLNNCGNTKVVQGELGSLDEYSFDAVFGNINRNILQREMKNLSVRLKNTGIAILSGFYENDLEKLSIAAGEYGLFPDSKLSLISWMVAVYRKGD